MIALCVATHAKTERFCNDLIDSLESFDGMPPVVFIISGSEEYPIETIDKMTERGGAISSETNLWEVGSIEIMRSMHTYCEEIDRIDEFVFLQDTFEFKKGQFWNFWSMIQCYRGCTLWFTRNQQMYAGKFRMEVLNRMQRFPPPNSKRQAVQMEEVWRKAYNNAETNRIDVLTGLDDSSVFEEKHGRNNMVCENEWMRKYKGTWQDNLQDRLRAIDERGQV